MKVVCIESFRAKTKNGERTVRKGEKLTVISGFGFLRLKSWRGEILHCQEDYLGWKLRECNMKSFEFLKVEEMSI